MEDKGEEGRDRLFDMNVGDGLIEVNEPAPPAEETAEEKAKREKAAPDKGEGYSLHDDGSFEIDDTSSKTTEESSEEDTFIEKTEKTEADKKTPSKTGSSDSSSSSPYLAFARDRADEGVFLDFNDEDWATLKERNEGDEAAALKELSQISIREMVKSGVESFKNSVTPNEKAYYEAKERGLPLDEYSVAKRNYEKYSALTESDLTEDIKLQEDVVAKALELRGYSPEEIVEEIDGYKSLENLGVKAVKALKGVPNVYKNKMDGLERGAKAAEQERQDGIRQRVAKMKQSVENIPEIIPGIKLNKPAREKILQSMTVPVAKDEDGNPLNPVMATRNKNPDAFEMMIHYYHSLGLFNISDDGQMKPDFSKISKVQKTKVADEFRSAFESRERSVSGKVEAPRLSDDELDDFDKAFGRL